jgi:hypothetical protein
LQSWRRCAANVVMFLYNLWQLGQNILSAKNKRLVTV